MILDIVWFHLYTCTGVQCDRYRESLTKIRKFTYFSTKYSFSVYFTVKLTISRVHFQSEHFNPLLSHMIIKLIQRQDTLLNVSLKGNSKPTLSHISLTQMFENVLSSRAEMAR